jgi:hypothetical protein
LLVSLESLLNPTTVGNYLMGMMDHFDPSRIYQWPAVEWAGSYAGSTDDATLDAATAFDTTGFANPVLGIFSWSLEAVDHTLSLTYVPSTVPEPGTLILISVATGILAFQHRRHAARQRGSQNQS